MRNQYFITAAALQKKLQDDTSGKIKVIDGTWKPGMSAKDLYAFYEAERIPGAKFFPIDEITSRSSPYPNMLPKPEIFEVWMENFGIKKDDKVIVYEQQGFFSAPRVLWTFHAFGHEDVKILEGGLGQWKEQGGPIESGPPTHDKGDTENYDAHYRQDLVTSYQDILDNLKRYGQPGYAQVLDARPPERFHGKTKEPRANLRCGHIPHSINIPFIHALDTKAPFSQLLSNDKLKQLFEREHQVDLDKPCIASCGSGVTACILYLALKCIGAGQVSVYDGSWSEYGSQKHAPLN